MPIDGLMALLDEIASTLVLADASDRESLVAVAPLLDQLSTLAEEGELLSGDVNGNLTEIVESVTSVTEIVAEVAAASQEQTRGVDQVSEAVTSMDKVVQQAAANSEESSSAAEELAAQAQELATMVARFKLDRAPLPRRPLPGDSAHWKRALAAGSPGGRRPVPAEVGYNLAPDELIPLDGDPDFADF